MIKLPNSVPAKFVSELADAICKSLKDAGIPFMGSGKFVNYLSKAFGYKDYNTLSAEHPHINIETPSPKKVITRDDMRAYLTDSVRDAILETLNLIHDLHREGRLLNALKEHNPTDFYQFIMFVAGEDERLKSNVKHFPLECFDEESQQYVVSHFGIRFRGNLSDFYQSIADACYKEEYKDELLDYANAFEDSLSDELNPLKATDHPWSDETLYAFNAKLEHFIDRKL